MPNQYWTFSAGLAALTRLNCIRLEVSHRTDLSVQSDWVGPRWFGITLALLVFLYFCWCEERSHKTCWFFLLFCFTLIVQIGEVSWAHSITEKEAVRHCTHLPFKENLQVGTSSNQFCVTGLYCPKAQTSFAQFPCWVRSFMHVELSRISPARYISFLKSRPDQAYCVITSDSRCDTTVCMVSL